MPHKIVFLLIGMLILTGCEKVDKSAPWPTKYPTATPTATATFTPTSTAIPTMAPTPVPAITATPVATATEEIVLPAGCYSWLIDSEDKFLTFVCGKAKPQQLTFTPGECVSLAAEAPEALAIHYVDSEGVVETEIVSPYEVFMCVWSTLTVEVWAETLTDYQAAECFGTLDSPDGSISIPLCSADNPQEIGLLPNQCLKVNTEQAVTIYFLQPTVLLMDAVVSLNKQPGESLCNSIGDVFTTEIWAGPLVED